MPARTPSQRVSWQVLKIQKDRPACSHCTIAMSPFRIHFDKAVWLCQESGCDASPCLDGEVHMVDLEVPLALINRLESRSSSASQGLGEPNLCKTTSSNTKIKTKTKRKRSGTDSRSVRQAMSPLQDDVSTDQCCSAVDTGLSTNEPFPLTNLPGEDTEEEDDLPSTGFSPDLGSDQQGAANSLLKPECEGEIDRLLLNSSDGEPDVNDESWMFDDDETRDQMSPAEVCSELDYRNAST